MRFDDATLSRVKARAKRIHRATQRNPQIRAQLACFAQAIKTPHTTDTPQLMAADVSTTPNVYEA